MRNAITPSDIGAAV